jgi:hypothetical protein
MKKKKKTTTARRQPSGPFSAQVQALAIGQSAARVVRLPVADTNEDEIKNETKRLRNLINQAVSLIRSVDGNNFRVESGQYLTSDAVAIIVCVTVTRVGGDPNDEAYPDDEESDI